MAPETPKKEPTAAEAMFFFAIVKHTKNRADIDWAAVATEQGFKNAEVAKVRFGQVRRKLGLNIDSGTPARTPTKSTGRVTKSTPKRGGAKPKKVKSEGTLDEDDDSGGDAFTSAPNSPTPGGKQASGVKREATVDFPDATMFEDM